jgi:hypothetical protein
MIRNVLFEQGQAKGCQIFLGKIYRNGEKCTKWKTTQWQKNILDGHKIFQMAIRDTKIFYLFRDPYWDCWDENISSGIPGQVK